MVIRRFEKKDSDDLYRLLSDAEAMKYLEAPFSREKTDSFLEDCCLSESPLIYAVEHEGEFIGYVICHDYDEESLEIGWVLFPKYWGKGIATELTRMLLIRAAENHKDAVIECVPEQAATIRIAEKYGFVFEGFEEGLNRYRLKQH